MSVPKDIWKLDEKRCRTSKAVVICWSWAGGKDTSVYGVDEAERLVELLQEGIKLAKGEAT